MITYCIVNDTVNFFNRTFLYFLYIMIYRKLMDQHLWLNKLKHIWRRKFAEINLYLD